MNYEKCESCKNYDPIDNKCYISDGLIIKQHTLQENCNNYNPSTFRIRSRQTSRLYLINQSVKKP